MCWQNGNTLTYQDGENITTTVQQEPVEAVKPVKPKSSSSSSRRKAVASDDNNNKAVRRRVAAPSARPSQSVGVDASMSSTIHIMRELAESRQETIRAKDQLIQILIDRQL